MADTLFRIFFDLLGSFLLIVYILLTPLVAGTITYVLAPESLILMVALEATLLLLPPSLWLFGRKRRVSRQA